MINVDYSAYLTDDGNIDGCEVKMIFDWINVIENSDAAQSSPDSARRLIEAAVLRETAASLDEVDNATDN